MPTNPFFSFDYFSGRRKNKEDAETNSQYQSSVTGESEQGYPMRDTRSYLDDVRDTYFKETPTQSAYREHLMNPPVQEKPSWGRRIGAALAGGATGYAQGPVAGIGVGRSIVEEPYNRQVQDWYRRGEAMGQQVENEDKQSQRRLGYLREVRSVAKDQAEVDNQMRQYDAMIARDRSNSAYRNAQLGETGRYHDIQNENADLDRAQKGTQFETGQKTIHRGQDLTSGTARRAQDIGASTAAANRASAEKRTAITANRPRGTNASASLNESRADTMAVREVQREFPEYANILFNDGTLRDDITITGEQMDYYTNVLAPAIERKKRQKLGTGNINSPEEEEEEVDFEIQ